MKVPEAERATWLADPPGNPLGLLRRWMDEAVARGADPEPGAMTLATTDADGAPSARVVLCRGFDEARGFLVFYTNRESRKGRALAARPRASLVFYWPALSRQVRIEGPVTLSPDAESDAYFAGRPLDAKLGAWASAQSEVLTSREALEAEMRGIASRFGVDPEAERDTEGRVPRPPHWGGYRVHVEGVEFWVSRRGRIHDRVRYARRLGPSGGDPGPWRALRLQP